jgi:hypothetical protein
VKQGIKFNYQVHKDAINMKWVDTTILFFEFIDLTGYVRVAKLDEFQSIRRKDFTLVKPERMWPKSIPDPGVMPFMMQGKRRFPTGHYCTAGPSRACAV